MDQNLRTRYKGRRLAVLDAIHMQSPLTHHVLKFYGYAFFRSLSFMSRANSREQERIKKELGKKAKEFEKSGQSRIKDYKASNFYVSYMRKFTRGI